VDRPSKKLPAHAASRLSHEGGHETHRIVGEQPADGTATVKRPLTSIIASPFRLQNGQHQTPQVYPRADMVARGGGYWAPLTAQCDANCVHYTFRR